MITFQDLTNNFANPGAVGDRIFRCEDETPRSTYYYYVRSAASDKDADLLMVSESLADDVYANEILSALQAKASIKALAVESIRQGTHPFTHVVLAPPEYHKCFKGVLDARRKALILVMPIFRCEFSGKESVDEFTEMRRHTIDTLNWRRTMAPKISLRFDNPATGGGIPGEPIPVRLETLKNQIGNLAGVAAGFIECTNWQGRVLEILSPEPNQYLVIRDRDEANRQPCEKATLLDVVWAFLTEGTPLMNRAGG